MIGSTENTAVFGYSTEDVARHVDNGRDVVMGVLRRGELRLEDVQHLRREVFAHGAVNQDDAEDLFAMERVLSGQFDAWTEFFVEAITDFTVWQMRPTGIVSEEQAQWLMDQVDRTKSVTALSALCNILAEADRVPAWLPAAARGRLAAGWDGVDEVLDAAREEKLAA